MDQEDGLSVISFDPSYFTAAAQVIRGEFIDDSDEVMGRKSKLDILHWLDSMAVHCRGDLRHLLQGVSCCVIVVTP
jgi:hypothetical protein